MRVPGNARGRVPGSLFWQLGDKEQERFRQGWWHAYTRKQASPNDNPLFRQGWVEAVVMLFDVGADIGPYRFTLSRQIGGDRGTVLFVMLNPSTADDCKDDPTIRRCTKFARLWGFTELRVVNLFASRATDPRDLKSISVVTRIGEGNDDVIDREIADAALVVAAWGKTGGFLDRKREFLRKRMEVPWMCLRQTRDGHPWHPLYVPYREELKPLDFEKMKGWIEA